MWCLRVHLAAVGIGIAQYVARKLYDHHLHAQTDAEGGNIVGATILGSNDFALYATLAEAWTDDYARHSREQLSDIALVNQFAIDEMRLHLAVVVGASMSKTLQNTLVGILQAIFSYQCDIEHLSGTVSSLKEIVPGLHGWGFANGYARLAQYVGIQSLTLHAHRHLVDARHVLTLHHAFQIDVAERSHLHSHGVAEMFLRSQHKDIGLYAHALKFLHRVLRRFGLQFVSRLEVGHIGKVHTHSIASQLPAQLTYSLHEWCTLNVADGAPHLGNHKVILLMLVVIVTEHTPFYLVGDVGHHLYCLAQVVASSLTVYHRLVYSPSGDAVVA